MENLSYPELQNDTKQKDLFPFSLEQVVEIHKAGLTLDLLFLLEQDLDEVKKIPKMAPYLQTLIRKEFVTEDLIITKAGEEVLALVKDGKSIVKAKKEKKVKVVTDFDRWWKAFPTSDAYMELGYRATRDLKSGKDKCMELVAKILAEGEYTIDDLILATETEVAAKKEESRKSKQNKLSYITNSESWLRQRKFESWIEIAKTQSSKPSSQKINKSFDI